jgi:hypothetical protein
MNPVLLAPIGGEMLCFEIQPKMKCFRLLVIEDIGKIDQEVAKGREQGNIESGEQNGVLFFLSRIFLPGDQIVKIRNVPGMFPKHVDLVIMVTQDDLDPIPYGHHQDAKRYQKNSWNVHDSSLSQPG